jgi:hypothetical protein
MYWKEKPVQTIFAKVLVRPKLSVKYDIVSDTMAIDVISLTVCSIRNPCSI